MSGIDKYESIRYDLETAQGEASLIRDEAFLRKDSLGGEPSAKDYEEANEFIEILHRDHPDVYEMGIEAMAIRDEVISKIGDVGWNLVIDDAKEILMEAGAYDFADWQWDVAVEAAMPEGLERFDVKDKIKAWKPAIQKYRKGLEEAYPDLNRRKH